MEHHQPYMTRTHHHLIRAAFACSLFAAGPVFAGSAPLPPAPAPPPAEQGGIFDTVGATLDVGYETHYIFRGRLVSEQNIWTQLALSVPLTEQLSLGFTAWYTSSTDSNYDELDLSAGLTYDARFATFGVGYTWYKFFDGNLGDGLGFDDVSELGVTASIPAGPVTISTGYYYDFEVEGHYIEAGLEAPIAVTDNFSIVPAALISYGVDYYSPEDGFQHLKLGVSFPIKLTSTATLTPWIAGNIPLDTYDDFYDDEVYGGVKLSVSF